MRNKLSRVAVQTSLWYAFFAALWIAASGGALAIFIRDVNVIEKIEIYKGWVFVAVTALLLYGVLRRQMQWIEKEAKAREQAEQLVRESQARFSTIFQLSPIGITLSRLKDGRLVDVNPALLAMIGYNRQEALGRTSEEVGVCASPEERNKLVEAVRSRGRVEGVELRYRKKSGDEGTALGSAELIRLAGEDHLLAMGLDVTERKKSEDALKESESRFRGAFEASSIGMALVDMDGRWLKVNRSLCESVGYTEGELLTKTFQDITHPDDLKNDLEHLKRLIADEISYYHIEKRYFHRDGYVVWALLCVSIVRDGLGYPLYFVAQIEDITEQKLLEEKLRAALVTDELTGLYNRRGFFELSEEQLWSAPRKGRTAALFLVKLEDMKLINDTFGHTQGDAIITGFGRTLQDIFREEDVVGRIGGVEFAVLATGTKKTLNRLFDGLKGNVAAFGNSDGRNRTLSVRIGTAFTRPHEAIPLEQLIAQADHAFEKNNAGRQAM